MTLNDLIVELTKIRDSKPELGDFHVGVHFDSEDADEEVNATDISMMVVHETDVIEDSDGNPLHVALTFGIS